MDLPAGEKWTCDTEPTKCAPTPTPEVAPEATPEVNKNPFVMETPEWCKPEYQLDKVADKIFKAGRAHELGGLIKTLETLLPLLQKQLEDLKKESK